MNKKVSSYISGPRWMGLGPYLVQSANVFGLYLTITNETGLITRTYYFTIEGDENEISRWRAAIVADLRKQGF